ncbi:MAG: Mrp/NBP35 family ATP-binding protein [Candidatus Binatia bacterium]
MISVEEIRRRLDEIAFPGFRHSLVRYGSVREVRVEDGDVSVSLLPVTARREVADEIRRRVEEALGSLAGVRSVRVLTAEDAHVHGAPSEPQRPGELPGVRRILAVSSAKGGVGKSTVAVNLALALHGRGSRVALMDADVYGPSVPMMMGVDTKPRPVGKKVAPIERYGLSLMSMGFFLDDKSPVIWRGPMVMGLIRQFLHDVEWGEQDYLVVDMPPGTGDAALTLAQQVPISGAVIVSTPQEVALQDVERGIAMFRQVHVPVLGIVENMSHYVCPHCGEREEVFGAGGGESLSRQFGVPLLATLPIVAGIREGGDAGRPFVVTEPDHPVSLDFRRLADAIDRALSQV